MHYCREIDIHDHESLVKAIKQVDVVISALGSHQVNDQTKIIDAIKEARNIKASVCVFVYMYIRSLHYIYSMY